MLKWITLPASLVSVSSQSHELGQTGIKYNTKSTCCVCKICPCFLHLLEQVWPFEREVFDT